MKRAIVSVACGIWVCAAVPLMAQSKPGILVELYTSQGCSSCPPADAYLAELVEQDGVIPLALHVDYWDYIGWADTFAIAKFTDRQRGYAHAAGRRMIFTPQMIIAGGESVEGNDPAAVEAAIARAQGAGSGVSLALTRVGDQVTIHAEANPPLTADSKVQLVRYRETSPVEIERGENAGRSITYHNIVTSWSLVGDWSGAAPLDLTAAVEGDDRVVVVIQGAGLAEVLAAAELQ
jgi:hypothetical protein